MSKQVGNVLARACFKLLGRNDGRSEGRLKQVRQRERELDVESDGVLQARSRNLIQRARASNVSERGVRDSLVPEAFALALIAAARTIGQRPFDAQILGALALQEGKIAEMQTGEGKTLASVLAIVWYALLGVGVHVWTVNDYLAERDATWMKPIYDYLGITVGFISQTSTPEQRYGAYQCDVTYATPNEVGFDLLRDGIARTPSEIVQRPFGYLLADEADSILIDEARIPLVIAGGFSGSESLALRADTFVRTCNPMVDFLTGEHGRSVQLTARGVTRAEAWFDCGNIFEERNLDLYTAISDALHAHNLLHHDIDYLVKDRQVEMIDEFKGRIALDRRWPAGLHTAVEAKERVALKQQGRILGTITIQHLANIYQGVCGMTGTAQTQARELYETYKLETAVIPTNRPMIRTDLPDRIFRSKTGKYEALVTEIHRLNALGRPVLVGTASVEESEHVSGLLAEKGIPHQVLNARDDAREARVIAQAGRLGAVTISTNMAGRGTDILLGGNPSIERDPVVAVGGIMVIGTTKHESRRIDNQLRGRAGRQGDPGSSQFLISFEDDLLQKYGVTDDVESTQRMIESQGLEARMRLLKYESVIERHRREIQTWRSTVLYDQDPETRAADYPELSDAMDPASFRAAERELTLAVIDECWSAYLAAIADIKAGIHWVAWGLRDPLYEYLAQVRTLHQRLYEEIEEKIDEAFETAQVVDGKLLFQQKDLLERGATWTYLVTDQPFGSFGERVMRGLARKAKTRSLFG